MAARDEVMVGSKLRSNDARENGKEITVTEVGIITPRGEDGVAYQTGKRRATVAYTRIFTDTKKRHQGYTLVR